MEVKEPSAKYLATRMFKNTEFGAMPEDWSCLSIKEIASNRQNAIVGGPFGSDLVSKDYVAIGVPVIRGQNMGCHYVSGAFAFVSSFKAKQLQANLARAGDIVFTQRGTLGQISIVPSRPYEAYLISQSQMKLSLNSDVAIAEYVYQYFASAQGQKKIFDSAIQTGVPHTNLGILRSYRIPVPPTVAEQQAIATALSDADALIESLEQLLAKKRQIKQGAMQELLTGKRRLPGFEGAWEVKRLGAICDIAMGRTPARLNSAYWGTGYKWLSIADLKSKVVSESKEEITALAASEMQIIRKGTLLMSFKLSIGRLCFAGCDLFTNEAICSFNNPQANVDYLYYILGRTDFSLYGKQAVKGYTLNKESLKVVEIPYPSIDEQTAIATTLSDMDTEISFIEAKLAKARALKQGMMQELLTGRIRLVAPQSEGAQ
jgi:type I restriction enzyme, S subunit